MSMSEAFLKEKLSSLYSGDWTTEYSQEHNDHKQVFVLKSESHPRWIVLRNDLELTSSECMLVDGLGEFVAHSPVEDPSFGELQDIVSHFRDVRILRYRPGKRITLTGVHPAQGKVIIKCVSSGVDSIYSRLSGVWAARGGLGFEVSEPISLVSSANTFIQRTLTGLPIGFSSLAFNLVLVERMARAAASLHRSGIQFEQVFSFDDQQQRSAKYLQQIAFRSPACAGLADQLAEQLSRMARTLEGRNLAMHPIHGSLHNHQWLSDEPNVALVDFDRASMGHPELDIATFLAQWDFEPSAHSTGIKRCFIDAYISACSTPVNPEVVCFYRAHKHLSKAYNACKQFGRPGSDARISRRLASALSILGDHEMLS